MVFHGADPDPYPYTWEVERPPPPWRWTVGAPRSVAHRTRHS